MFLKIAITAFIICFAMTMSARGALLCRYMDWHKNASKAAAYSFIVGIVALLVSVWV